MISVFLGAGFSYVAGVPLANQLFDRRLEVDRITRKQLVNTVLLRWKDWEKTNGRAPEEYLASLQEKGGRQWNDAIWYVALTIALHMGKLEKVGMQPTIIKHNINRTTENEHHEKFWTIIFRKVQDITVITTNYDILPERGIRHEPRPRVPRPGFHYGEGHEILEGGGYPSYAHIQKIAASGTIPIYKLHGSISWSYKNGRLLHYHDCRPAIRGDAAIIAPVTNKVLPKYFHDIWEKAAKSLSKSNIWIVVGYSLPEYDLLVRELLSTNSSHNPLVHIFDPDTEIFRKYQTLLPNSKIIMHPGLPEGLKNLSSIL